MDYLQDLIAGYSAHFSIAAVVLLILTFVDGLVVVGLLINGWLAFGVSVYSYANGYITWPMMVAVSLLGVFSAEQVSYFIGRRCGPAVINGSTRAVAALERLKQRRFGRLIPFGVSAGAFSAALHRAPDRIQRWGGFALVVGRWTPLAALGPALCATLGMPYSRFVRFSALACTLWVVIWDLIIYLGVNGYIALTR